MDQQSQARSWWQTVPGMLTGAAAVITAVTGLFLAFNQAGWLRRDAAAVDSEADRGVPAQSSLVTPPEAASSSSQAAGASVSAVKLVPSVAEVTVSGIKFTLLDVQTQPRNPDSYGLRINVRFHNDGPYPANFWNANFRLLVDDVPRAPTGDLNKVVEGHSAVEGDVEFVVPASARSLALQIRMGEETTAITLRQ